MQKNQKPKPPQVLEKPHQETWHREVREDPYYWLREKDNPEVTEYLQAENAYADSALSETKDLQEKLFTEIKDRIKEDDQTVPVYREGCWYYSRTEKGKEYPIYCRRQQSMSATEEIVFDQNQESAGYDFFSLGICDVSPDGKYLAYAIDTTGSEEFVIYVRDLATGKELPEVIKNSGGCLEWANDSRNFYYTTRDNTLRPDTVWLHTLESNPEEDKQIWQDTDGRFFVTLHKSKDEAVVCITSASKQTSEVWYLDANQVSVKPVCILPRVAKHEYYVEHHSEGFYIVSNWEAPNFRLFFASHNDLTFSAWQEIIAHREKIAIESIEVFADYVCVYEMREGITDLAIYDRSTAEIKYVNFAEPVRYVQSLDLPDYNDKLLRVHYSSLATPGLVYDIDLKTKEKEVKKRTEVRGYDPTEYQVERMYAVAEDGIKVPVSLLKRVDTKEDGTAPGLLEGYGSYGISFPLVFRPSLVSLLDRGFVYAIAHIRGGGECGRAWYEEGKFLEKKNTFTDFIAVAEFLSKQAYVSPTKLIAHGGSAGGLLMGAVTNMRPDLFQAVVADVPFVDVLNTMCDASLPLTVMEYEEWGDPNDKEYYQYIKSYAPYENVSQQAYPYVLAWVAMNDSRVPYWEAAKWVAKLRKNTTSDKEILLKVDMGQGHGGASGRYKHWREQALRYAFMLWAIEE